MQTWILKNVNLILLIIYANMNSQKRELDSFNMQTWILKDVNLILSICQLEFLKTWTWFFQYANLNIQKRELDFFSDCRKNQNQSNYFDQSQHK